MSLLKANYASLIIITTKNKHGEYKHSNKQEFHNSPLIQSNQNKTHT